MAGLNKVMLIGNLGRDPEIRYSQQGLAIVSFSIATSEQWTDKNTGDRQEKTEWHRIVAFGKPAEILEKYLSKGSQVYIEGRLQTRNYEKDGQTHYATEVVVATFQFIGGKQDNPGQGGGRGYQQNQGGGYQNQNQGGGSQQSTSSQQSTGANNQYQGQANQGPTNPGMAGGQEPIPDDDIPF